MTENEPPCGRIEGIGVTALVNVGAAEWYDSGTDAEIGPIEDNQTVLVKGDDGAAGECNGGEGRQ